MNATMYAQQQAHTAAAARACGASAMASNWCTVAKAGNKPNFTATKRTARHLGQVTT
ncbi:MAG: hypothetical protein RLZ14_855 [Actinomycetota bacterium]|jgi:hypothetical protein